MPTDHSSITVALPPISDEAAVDIINFIEVAHQLFEDRQGRQIHRHYDRRSQHNVVQSNPISLDHDLPF